MRENPIKQRDDAARERIQRRDEVNAARVQMWAAVAGGLFALITLGTVIFQSVLLASQSRDNERMLKLAAQAVGAAERNAHAAHQSAVAGRDSASAAQKTALASQSSVLAALDSAESSRKAALALRDSAQTGRRLEASQQSAVYFSSASDLLEKAFSDFEKDGIQCETDQGAIKRIPRKRPAVVEWRRAALDKCGHSSLTDLG